MPSNFTLTQASDPGYAQRIAYTADGKAEYIGEALAGTLDATAGWRIKKLTYSGDNVVSTKWAAGTNKMVKKWDDGAGTTYASYTYS